MKATFQHKVTVEKRVEKSSFGSLSSVYLQFHMRYNTVIVKDMIHLNVKPNSHE